MAGRGGGAGPGHLNLHQAYGAHPRSDAKTRIASRTAPDRDTCGAWPPDRSTQRLNGPDLDDGEITDKGDVHQRAVREQRVTGVELLSAEPIQPRS